MQLAGTTIRVACNQASRTSFVNAFGGQSPVIPRAGSVRMPCAIFVDDPSDAQNLLTDLSNIVTANCVMRAGSATGAVLYEAVIAATQFTTALTFDEWTAGTAAHFEFALTPTDTNLAEGPLWIAIGVSTSDAGDISLVYCSTATVKDYGIFNAAAPTAPDYTAWSKAESDSRYAPLGAAGDFAPAITSVGDNASGSLEQVVTIGAAIPTLRSFISGGELQDWLLVAGDDATDSLHQQPDDFNASTNARIWVRKR